MSRPLEELPLFPLNTVLFPFSPLQLHIFEPRYREMIQRCLDEEIAFGVVLIRSGSETGEDADPYLIGTAARIETAHTYEDGRMDIRVRGERRFRIREIDETRPYLVGKVEPLFEEWVGEDDESSAVIAKAREIGEAYVTHLFAGFDFKVAKVKLHDDPVILSFLLAGLVPGTNLEKQHLLESTNTHERLAELIPMLEQLIEQAQLGPSRVTAQDVLPYLSQN